jgi:dipeptidyl aminopeptidase/acylaminoacyl peptidase
MMKKSAAVLLGIFLAVVAFADQGPFTLEQVLSSPFPSELTAAPKGARLAWVFKSPAGRNIWVADGPQFRARQLTRYEGDTGIEISSLGFTADGAWLVYVRGGNKNSAGEVPNPTSDPDGVDQEIWAIAVAGGNPPRRIDAGNSPVVAPRGDRVAYIKENKIWLATVASPGKPRKLDVRGQNSSPVWSPDGTQLAFVSNRSSHSLIAVYDVARRTIRYIAPSVDRDSFPRWSPDGKSIAFVRMPARTGGPAPGPGAALLGMGGVQRWAIWVADLASGEARQIWESADKPEGNIPRMAGAWVLQRGAGDRIVFSSEEDGWQRLYSIPATGGEPIGLTPTGCEFEQASFTPDRKQILFSSNCGDIDRRHLQRVTVTGGTVETLTPGEGIEWLPVPTGDGKWVGYFASDARRPAMPYVRAANASGPGTMLAASALPKDFPSDKLVVPQQVILTAADGVKFHNQLFLPPNIRPGEKRPAVIFMHGGPVRQMMLGWHNRGYYHQAYAVNQYLASRGYIVLSVNYRSGIMYGRAFREAENRGARGASEYQDIVAAGKYLASRPDVDPRRIGLWGGSYGGYLTALGLARNSDLFAAGVDLHGVHDWSSRTEFGGTAGMSPEALRLARESSPVASVDKWRSPVLLVHGDDDRNVNFSQTVDLVARLRRQGVKFEQMVFPDEVHDFLLHRHWLKIYAATVDFFDRYMK